MSRGDLIRYSRKFQKLDLGVFEYAIIMCGDPREEHQIFFFFYVGPLG